MPDVSQAFARNLIIEDANRICDILELNSVPFTAKWITLSEDLEKYQNQFIHINNIRINTPTFWQF